MTSAYTRTLIYRNVALSLWFSSFFFFTSQTAVAQSFSDNFNRAIANWRWSVYGAIASLQNPDLRYTGYFGEQWSPEFFNEIVNSQGLHSRFVRKMAQILNLTNSQVATGQIGFPKGQHHFGGYCALLKEVHYLLKARAGP